MVFHVVPTALEICMVGGILVRAHPVCSLLVAHTRRTDLQIRPKLRRDHFRDHGRLHLVHRDDDSLAVCRVALFLEIDSDLSRTNFRKAANAADNKAASVSVDSLINYEAVKVHRAWPVSDDR